MKRVVPGIHSVHEALMVRPESVQEIWVREGEVNRELQSILILGEKHKLKTIRKGIRSLDSEISSHQGVIAFVGSVPEWPSGKELKELTQGLIFALDCLEDPHNVGSLVRSAWNFGGTGVLSSKDRSAGQAASAQKVACGGFEHVPVLEAANLHSELQTLKDVGFWIYGLQKEGGEVINQVSLAKKSVFVLGAEEHGLRKPIIGACDGFLRIPQIEESDSFNASVAGAIAGYEFVRQHPLSENLKNSRKKV